MSSTSSLEDICSSDISTSEEEELHSAETAPKKKRYKRALHSLNKRRAKYYNYNYNGGNEASGNDHRSSFVINNTVGHATCTFSDSIESAQCSNVDQLKTVYNTSPTSFVLSSDSEHGSCTLSHLSDSDSDASDILSSSCSSGISSTPSSDDGLSDRDDQDNICDDDGPLYEGCNHTFLTSYMMVMLLVQKHSFTKDAFTDILRLVATHLPSTCRYSKSIYKVKDYLKRVVHFQDTTEHKYCEHCCQIISPTIDVCPSETCQQRRAKVLEFHDLHLDQQLRDLFQDEHFVTMVTSRKPIHPDAADIKQDITDGSEYKRLQQNATTGAVNLTFTMNTDGVALFKSSKTASLWPIYVAINELPLPLRFSKKFILTTHLHNQKDKPNMLTYMGPLMSTMEMLSGKGMEVPTSRGKLLVKAQLLATTVDLPAKAMVANAKQFNGKFGCSVCLDEGAGRPNCPQHRYWPFNPDSMPRTHQGWIEDAKEAVASQTPVHGIKGASPLVALKNIDLPKMFVVDWKHCVLLGVTKTLMKLWFSGDCKREPFSIADKMSLLNHRLQNIQIPDFISREQRNLEDHAHWKASECREWLLHYSIPVLEGVLPDAAYIHYSLLVTSMYLLNKEQITGEDIRFAEELVLDFCRLFPNLYGEYHQTMNIHLLKHLPHFVRLHGPLFATSCFGFESMNNHLKKMIHGTRYVNKQVGFAVAMTKALPQVIKQWTEQEGVVHPDIQSLAQHLSSKFMCEEESTRLDALGKRTRFLPTDQQNEFMMPVLEQHNVHQVPLLKFFRLRRGHQVYYSKQYMRVKRRNSYTVACGDGKVGEVDYYLCADNVHFAVVHLFNIINDPVVLVPENVEYEVLRKYRNKILCPQIKRVRSSNNFILVHISELRKKCIFMKFGDSVFISEPPNLLEHN